MTVYTITKMFTSNEDDMIEVLGAYTNPEKAIEKAKKWAREHRECMEDDLREMNGFDEEGIAGNIMDEEREHKEGYYYEVFCWYREEKVIISVEGTKVEE